MLRILVAEDNQVNQLVVKAMLAGVGHRLDMVENGRDAVAAVRDNDYDLVLMDAQMPGMDGIGATRAIRALPDGKASIPIVVVTANAMAGDREKYLAAGMDDYISKPLDSGELIAVIDRVTGRDSGVGSPPDPAVSPSGDRPADATGSAGTTPGSPDHPARKAI